MNETHRTWMYFVGATVAGMLYLVCVFFMGLLTAHAWASRLAVAAYGAVYLCSIAQACASARWPLVLPLFLLSILLGLAAGVALLT